VQNNSVLLYHGLQYSNIVLCQALVVLVHDMDENWELVSDALNSIVQLKVRVCLILSFSFDIELSFFPVHEKVSHETNLVVICKFLLFFSTLYFSGRSFKFFKHLSVCG
jgi:hypothetical protein